MMGWNDAAAVAKREVISSGVIEVCDSRYEAAVIAAVRRSGDGNLRRYEEEHHGGGKIYLLDL